MTEPADPSAREPGPLGEQAARLVASVQDWALRSFASSDAMPATNAGHSANGGNCQWCPLCQLVAVLRGDRPEVTARVAEAGAAVVAALRAIADAASGAAPADTVQTTGADEPTDSATGQHRRPAPGPATSRVQRIDLTDPT
jgi:hypothetical protein